jgi:hypothetical protein
MSWKISGYDTFANEAYPLGGRYASQAAAERAARKRLGLFELMQPGDVSGGQAGIQDHVYVHRPDGSSYRFTHPEPIRPGFFMRLAWRLGLLG